MLLEPSPFYDPESDARDLDAFLAEVDRALDELVLAHREDGARAAAPRATRKRRSGGRASVALR
ncbi:MAG: hypothetical protein QM704_19670 [Anaeromyxobacteraceae bacterium]